MELVILRTYTHLDGQMLRSMNLAAQVRSEGQLLSMASVPLLTHSLSLLPRTQEHLQRDGGALRRGGQGHLRFGDVPHLPPFPVPL